MLAFIFMLTYAIFLYHLKKMLMNFSWTYVYVRTSELSVLLVRALLARLWFNVTYSVSCDLGYDL